MAECVGAKIGGRIGERIDRSGRVCDDGGEIDMSVPAHASAPGHRCG
jgi:hypothetical protein